MQDALMQWRCSAHTPVPAEACGWDIGGAHLKAVGLDRRGHFRWAVQAATPLWQGLESLRAAMRAILPLLQPGAVHVLTLTGEAADCFTDRSAGVHALIALWQGEFPGARAWLQVGGPEPQPLGEASPEAMAASGGLNFLAAGHVLVQAGLSGVLADMGSTTTDLLVVRPDGVQPTAVDDAGRLASGELVYQGLTRTPLTALGPRVPFDGRWHGLMNEHFATTADVHRLTGQLDESADLHPAADQGEKSPRGSARRLARTVGLDLDAAPIDRWQQLARWFAQRQQRELVDGLALIASRHPRSLAEGLIVTGAGAHLLAGLARTLSLPCTRLSEHFATGADAPWVERCTPAWASARLLVAALARAQA